MLKPQRSHAEMAESLGVQFTSQFRADQEAARVALDKRICDTYDEMSRNTGRPPALVEVARKVGIDLTPNAAGVRVKRALDRRQGKPVAVRVRNRSKAKAKRVRPRPTPAAPETPKPKIVAPTSAGKEAEAIAIMQEAIRVAIVSGPETPATAFRRRVAGVVLREAATSVLELLK